MRAIWSGSISFGLINIPVRLHSGVQPAQSLDLDMLHAEDHSPIRYAKICRDGGEEVPWEEIVKGYEYREGDYIILTKEDFKKADREKTSTLDIQQFVDEEEIDIRFYDKPYYVEPTEDAEQAYALLREALHKSNKLALVQFVLRQREYVGVLKPMGRAIVLVQMRYQSDLRGTGNLRFPSDKSVDQDELEMATELIEKQTKPFFPEDFHDTYREEIEEVIEQKAKGKKPKARGKVPASTPPQDLRAALEASLSNTKR